MLNILNWFITFCWKYSDNCWKQLHHTTQGHGIDLKVMALNLKVMALNLKVEVKNVGLMSLMLTFKECLKLVWSSECRVISECCKFRLLHFAQLFVICCSSGSSLSCICFVSMLLLLHLAITCWLSFPVGSTDLTRSSQIEWCYTL